MPSFEYEMKKGYARYTFWTTQNQIKPLNGTNAIIRLITQYKRKYKPKSRNDQLLWSIWNFKVSLFKALLNRRELLWATFVNIVVYGGYVYNHFDQV